MITLGLRCTPSEFSFVVIDGTQTSHVLVHSEKIRYPPGFGKADVLNWFYQEMARIIDRYRPNAIGIKGTEPIARKQSGYGDRIEIEALIFLQAQHKGISAVQRKVDGTIAKDMGLKGRGRYLADFDYSSIDGFEKMSSHLQEAVQVAISMLS